MPTVSRFASGYARPAALIVGLTSCFVIVLFVARYVARGHLALCVDEECVGGVAVEVLAHGVRYPLAVYAENNYDNGFFVSGLITAALFSIFGRRVLAFKLEPLVVSAAAAVATLALVMWCLRELQIEDRRAKRAALAAALLGIVIAPRVATAFSMIGAGLGTHPEGAAVETIMLALFAWRLHRRSVAETAAFWIAAGVAFWINRGMIFVLPVLAAMQVVASRRRLADAAGMLGGFAIGVAPDWIALSAGRRSGWDDLMWKVEERRRMMPRPFVEMMMFFADGRIELLGCWAVALALATVLCVRCWRSARSERAAGSGGAAAANRPIIFTLLVGVTWYAAAVLLVVAQGGIDPYAMHLLGPITVLVAVVVGWFCTRAAVRWGERSGAVAAGVAMVAILFAYWPETLSWEVQPVAALWRDEVGAVCSYRFGEGFMRRQEEYWDGRWTAEGVQHAIAGCRSLSERSQVLDCIGGVTYVWLRVRELESVGMLPPGLDDDEARAFAYYFGIRNNAECDAFADPPLQDACKAAARLSCLVQADKIMRIVSGRYLGRPHCDIAAPPMQAFWAARREELLARPVVAQAGLEMFTDEKSPTDMTCRTVYRDCY